MIYKLNVSCLVLSGYRAYSSSFCIKNSFIMLCLHILVKLLFMKAASIGLLINKTKTCLVFVFIFLIRFFPLISYIRVNKLRHVPCILLITQDLSAYGGNIEKNSFEKLYFLLAFTTFFKTLQFV